jgi:large subunit ribosomal protein L19
MVGNQFRLGKQFFLQYNDHSKNFFTKLINRLDLRKTMKAQKLTKETISALGVTPRAFPEFAVGDSIALSQWITEGDKKRLQVFEGDVIAFSNNGASTTFILRKIGANSVAVERIFPYYSPVIDSIKVLKRGDVRRAKLFYVRDRVGKKARIKELVLTKEERALQAEKHNEKVANQAISKD